jgi:hypothetical protein
MSDIPHRRHASNASAKLHFPFIIYCIIMLFQALIVRVLADISTSANTVDPTHSYIPSKTVEAQIWGGADATDGEFPYLVMIRVGSDGGCSGVILSSRWVLTDAYTLINPNGTHNSTSFELRVPKSDITVGYGSIRNTTLNWVSIKDVWVHPQFDLQNPYYYNLALVELATSLPLSGRWSPVRITPEIVSTGDELMAASWAVGRGKESFILQKVQLTAGSYSKCQDDPDWDGNDGELVCATSESGSGICHGDGGSPLVLPDSPDSDEGFAGYLVGILSFFRYKDLTSRTCENHSGLNYFTRVAKHIDWIADVMGVNSSELLATPRTSESDEDDEFLFPNSAVSFPMKSSHDTLLSIMLCLLALSAIAFNN